MAIKPLRPCRHPGCYVLVSGGYCDAHKPKDSDRRSEESKAWRWMYSTDEWTQDIRPMQLLREPLCLECSTSSRIAETGPSSQTATTSRAYATHATAAKQPRKCGRKALLSGADIGADQQDAWALGRRVRTCESCSRVSLQTLPPGQESFGRGA